MTHDPDQNITMPFTSEDTTILGEGKSEIPADFREWAKCSTRGVVLRQSLKDRASEFRANEDRCRKAFRQPFMSEPMNYLADLHAEAAQIYELALERFNAAREGF